MLYFILSFQKKKEMCVRVYGMVFGYSKKFISKFYSDFTSHIFADCKL